MHPSAAPEEAVPESMSRRNSGSSGWHRSSAGRGALPPAAARDLLALERQEPAGAGLQKSAFREPLTVLLLRAKDAILPWQQHGSSSEMLGADGACVHGERPRGTWPPSAPLPSPYQCNVRRERPTGPVTASH